MLVPRVEAELIHAASLTSNPQAMVGLLRMILESASAGERVAVVGHNVALRSLSHEGVRVLWAAGEQLVVPLAGEPPRDGLSRALGLFPAGIQVDDLQPTDLPPAAPATVAGWPLVGMIRRGTASAGVWRWLTANRGSVPPPGTLAADGLEVIDLGTAVDVLGVRFAEQALFVALAGREGGRLAPGTPARRRLALTATRLKDMVRDVHGLVDTSGRS